MSFTPFSRTKVPGFNVKPQDAVPGFRVDPQDDDRRGQIPGFNVKENGPTGQDESGPGSDQTPTWPGIGSPASGPGGFAQSAPYELPEWLSNLLAMPLPTVPDAFDPRTGQRIVPYAPLIRPVGLSPTMGAAPARNAPSQPAWPQAPGPPGYSHRTRHRRM